jgi:hypothetical protein
MQEVTNCGFVSWVDAEWPVQLQNALGKIWGMYNESDGQRLDECAQLYHKLKELTAEKKKYEKKYCSLVNDVNSMMDAAEKTAVEKNLLKMKEKEGDELAEMKRQRNVLMEEMALLKQNQKQQEEMTKLRNDKWEKERQKLKEEKKKAEYYAYELLKAGEAKKQKLQSIKKVLDELCE